MIQHLFKTLKDMIKHVLKTQLDISASSEII